MCDEAVDDSLAAFKLIPDWFFAREMIKNFILLCTQMKIYYFNPHMHEIFLQRYCMKWVPGDTLKEMIN